MIVGNTNNSITISSYRNMSEDLYNDPNFPTDLLNDDQNSPYYPYPDPPSGTEELQLISRSTHANTALEYTHVSYFMDGIIAWDNMPIYHNTFDNCYSSAITLQAEYCASSNDHTQHNIINDCYNGIVISYANTSNLAIVSNNTINSSTHGIYICSSNGCQIYNNIIYDCNKAFYFYYSSTIQTIANNHIESCNYGFYNCNSNNNNTPCFCNNNLIDINNTAFYSYGTQISGTDFILNNHVSNAYSLSYNVTTGTLLTDCALLFGDSEYHLLHNSPLVDAGCNPGDNPYVDCDLYGTAPDIGIYGGPYAENHILCLGANSGSFQIGDHSPYRITENITVPAGQSYSITSSNSANCIIDIVDNVIIDVLGTFNISSSTSTPMSITIGKDVTIHVSGTLNILGNATNPVSIVNEDALWSGINYDGNSNASQIAHSYIEGFKSLTVTNSHTLNVSYTSISNCGSSSSAALIISKGGLYNHIHGGLVSNGPGIKVMDSQSRIYLTDIIANGSVSSTIEVYKGYANLNSCTICDNTDSYGLAMHNCSTGSIKGTTFSNNKIGILLDNSIPIFREENVVEYNIENGIMLINGSNIAMGHSLNPLFGNVFGDNGSTGSSSKNADILLNGAVPYLANMHNDIVDNRGASNQYLIYNAQPPSTPLDISYNYLSTYPPAPLSRFFPLGAFVYTNGDAVRNFPGYTYLSVDDLALAASLEDNGEFSDAADVYLDIVYTEEIPSALSAWVRCCFSAGIETENIVNELNAWLGDDIYGKTAFWLKISVLNHDNSYEESITILEDYIMQAETENDSLMGLYEELITYYQMMTYNEDFGNLEKTVPGNNPAYQVGQISYAVPRSQADFDQKEEDLLAQMHQKLSTSINEDNLLPKKYCLRQNYPNPFNPTTTLSFDLVHPETVKLSVYNIMGQEVAQLLDCSLQAGSHSINFDASNLASGLYFYRIEAGSFIDMKRMVLVK